MVIWVAVFLDKWLLIYVKPFVPLSLVLLYLKSVKRIRFLFPLSMVIIAVTDILIYVDFVKYYILISILIALFYVLCIVMLKRYVNKKDVKLSMLFSPPVIISTLLIAYLIFSVTELVLPKIINDIKATVLIIVSALLFSGVSFFIYLSDRYEKSIYLFIATCCTLFVDFLLAINEFYFYNRVFTVLINIAEIGGIYFFVSFFIETKRIDSSSKEEGHF